MVVSWKIPGIYPVEAQAACEELDRIYKKRGKMEAADIVEESRPDDAVLHPCFEWRNDVAAELYREHQARGICRLLVTTCESADKESVAVRAVVHAAKSYRPIDVVLKSADMREELLKNAFRDMEAFRTKYATLSELSNVFNAMEAAQRKEE